MNQTLQEFSFFPSGLKEVDSINGGPLYSSDEIIQQFSDLMESNSIFGKNGKIISSLIKKGIVLPCYTSPGLISNIFSSFSNRINKNILAMFYPKSNKVYIIVNRIDGFYKSGINNDKLVYILFHELMHYFAWNNDKKFITSFEPQLIKYYTHFFNLYMNKDFKKEEIIKYIRFLFSTFELKEKVTRYDLFEYSSFLSKNFRLTEEQVEYFIRPIITFIYNPNAFYTLINRDKNINGMVFSLYDSYGKAFGLDNPQTTPIQEMLYVSEVAAITAEQPLNIHINALKHLV